MTDHPPFTVIAESDEPIYLQLVAQVRRRVAAGLLRAGDELPSARTLAHALAVNPMTVSKAFGMLQAEGLLARRPGQPMVVAARHDSAQSAAARLEQLRPILERAAAECRELRLPASEAIKLFRTVLASASA